VDCTFRHQRRAGQSGAGDGSAGAVRGRRLDADPWTLSLHLATQRGAWRATVFPAGGVEQVSGSVAEAAPAPLNGVPLTIIGLPAEGVDFVLIARATGPLSCVVVEQTMRLAEPPGVPPRPDSLMTASTPEELRGYPTFVAATSFRAMTRCP
jgi:hypothetical protein